MPSHLLILVLSLALLAKSADWLVEYGARLARRMGVSDLVVGLTMTSVGTSVPELASSVSAAASGHPSIVIGNVVGSNIANIGLILGLAAVVKPFQTDPRMHFRDGFMVLAVAIGFFILVLDNHIGRIEAGAFLLVYAAYVGFVALTDQDKIEFQFRNFLDYFVELRYARPIANKLLRKRPAEFVDKGKISEHSASRTKLVWELAAVLGCLAGVALGARFFIAEAVWIARALSIPEALVGISLVALGTSLPELLVAISAARKGNTAMVVGNVMGSNIANVLLVVGISGLIRPMDIAEISVVYTIPIMMFFSIGLVHLVRSNWQVTRTQGALAIIAYVVFIRLAFVEGWQ